MNDPELTVFAAVTLGVAILGAITATVLGLADAVGRRREERYLRRTGRS